MKRFSPTEGLFLFLQNVHEIQKLHLASLYYPDLWIHGCFRETY